MNLPPSSVPVDAERMLLASAFIDARWLTTARVDLTPLHFSEPKHQEIWQAILLTAPEAGTADEVSLIAHLSQSQRLDLAGGASTVSELGSMLMSPSQAVERWQKMVEDGARLRAIARAISQLHTMAESGQFTPAELSERAAAIASVTEERKKGDNGPQLMQWDDLLSFDKDNDPNAVLGHRWLCRGGSCLWVGGTGQGKSTLSVQAAITWALGRDLFGIKSRIGPLRSLVIGAENDLGDTAEQIHGCLAGLNIPHDSELMRQVRDRVVFYREAVRTGEDFGKLLRNLIVSHRADLVWVDPLLAYAGIDVTVQSEVSHFTRHILQPILQETGCILMAAHHTNKPTRVKEQTSMTLSELAYAYAGSAEFANWFRASAILTKDNVPEGQEERPYYHLRLAKRASRAGAKDAFGEYTTAIPIRHAKEHGVIRWDLRNDVESYQDTPPIERKGTAKPSGRSDLGTGSRKPY